MKDQRRLLVLMGVCLLLASCARKEPELTDVEAGEMVTGVVVTNHGQRLRLTGKQLSRVQVISGTQKGAGTNYTVRVKILTPDPTTSELMELRGEITFVRHEYGRSRVGFRQIQTE